MSGANSLMSSFLFRNDMTDDGLTTVYDRGLVYPRNELRRPRKVELLDALEAETERI